MDILIEQLAMSNFVGRDDFGPEGPIDERKLHALAESRKVTYFERSRDLVRSINLPPRYKLSPANSDNLVEKELQDSNLEPPGTGCPGVMDHAGFRVSTVIRQLPDSPSIRC
jgi:hypothetical protein